MRRTLRRLSLLTLVTAAACNGGNTFVPELTSRDPARQKEVWDRENILSYDYTYTRQCECLPLGEVRVSVRGGNVYDVVSTTTGQQLPHDRWNEIPTVNQLFAELIAAYQSGEEFQAMYDRRLRYPAAAVIGDVAVDAGTAHYITELERYEGPWFP
ncbi:MAG TPA: DUF6174 domain-containing protein [Longimicrobium sp.]|nr:DUF6174 domain-containing protein [Longimicrobium sp.]